MSNKFLIETSARHVHLNKEALNLLFGEGYVLRPKKELSQKGQFVCEEKIAVVGEKASFKSVSILGPERKDVQVEISKTDARNIGVEAFIRESGDLKGTAGCKLIGPKGELILKEGVIVAKRHIHANFDDAEKMQLKNGDIVFVNVLSQDRGLIFKDVVVRVNDSYSLAMHIDTDEANAANIISTCTGEIFKVQ